MFYSLGIGNIHRYLRVIIHYYFMKIHYEIRIKEIFLLFCTLFSYHLFPFANKFQEHFNFIFFLNEIVLDKTGKS